MGFLLLHSKEQVVSSQPKLELVSHAIPHPHALSVAILGFGTVGRSVAEILSYSADPRLHLTHIFNRNIERKRVSWTSDDVEWTDDVESVLSADADIVVEAIGGLDPAE